ncbi:MAG: ribonuclease III [Actinobacteria bacterium]|nr:ribonuclease III [Actinomycetota bacterium]
MSRHKESNLNKVSSDLLKEYSNHLEKLENQLGIKFKNKSLLLISCIHASFANEKGIKVNNEKLEFLGDAVLSLIISEFLYKKTDKSSEGELSKAKSIIASEKTLADFAYNMGFDSFLLLGKGASKEERGKRSNLADFTEALLGAIYLDRGFRVVKRFVKENLLNRYIDIDFVKHDPKSTLQELLVKKYHSLPKYKVIYSSGPAHAKKFVCGVFLRDKIIGTGEGQSKKEAEKQAALEALKSMGYYHGEFD